jgi:hypothetical protein
VSQITLYLDEETEARMKTAAQAAGVSLSKWVAGLIRDRTASHWPASVEALAGAWAGEPEVLEVCEPVPDVPREPF